MSAISHLRAGSSTTMIVFHVLAFVFGAVVALAILGSALKTVVLPQEGFPRLSQAIFSLVYVLLVHRWRNKARQSALRSLYAPVALVSLPLVWMILMVIAFTFIFWGTGSETSAKAFEISGSSLTTLGFSKPDGTSRIWLSFIEATIGLGLVALLISYLPTIFSAYNGREKGIIRLRPVAGAPPKATDLLQTLRRMSALTSPEFWRNQSDWILEVEQSHTAFPILSYFPETHVDHSWVATMGTLLDAAALVLSASEARAEGAFEEIQMGPLMILVYGIPAINRIARAASVPLPEPSRLPELTVHFTEPAPAISIERAEYVSALAAVAPILAAEEADVEASWRRFAWTRSGYDSALRALGGLTKASPASWTTDRAAAVGRPRFIGRRPIYVDWSAGLPAAVDPVAPTGG